MKSVVLFSLAVCSTLCFSQTVILTEGIYELECECLLESQGCQSTIYQGVGKSPVHQWTSDLVAPAKGLKTDTAKACYDKRKVSGEGDMLCCEPSKSTARAIKNKFRGVIPGYTPPAPGH